MDASGGASELIFMASRRPLKLPQTRKSIFKIETAPRASNPENKRSFAATA